jgi:hypothetical protein
LILRKRWRLPRVLIHERVEGVRLEWPCAAGWGAEGNRQQGTGSEAGGVAICHSDYI